MPKLSKEEREIIEAFERGELQSVCEKAADLKQHREAAATFRKDSRVNIRISGKVLRALRKLAVREGIPYQTLTSVLHKYVGGRLWEDG